MTGGGLRWIRYRFINEQQAGTAVADSYHAVSICKAGRTIGGGGGDWSGAQRWKSSERVSEVVGDIVL